MKKFIIFSLIIFLVGCNSKKWSRSEIVTEYYTALDSSNFSQLKTLISDSFTIVDGDYTTTYSHASFYKQFKWDSIFQTTYEVIEITDQDDEIIATVASNSLRFEFLKNDPLICRYKVSFKEEKISKIEVVDYVAADWTAWQMERDSLVSWIGTNHPELNGFIHDLSMKGAMNYLKAIELYESSEASD